MRVPLRSGSMWMSLALSRTAVRKATLTRFTIGLPSTIRSRSVIGPSSIVSRSTTWTSVVWRLARNSWTSVLPPAYLRTNSRMLLSIARTGRISQPLSWASRSTAASDCGSAIATVSMPRTRNMGSAWRRSASCSPMSLRSSRIDQAVAERDVGHAEARQRADAGIVAWLDQLLLDEQFTELPPGRPLAGQRLLELLLGDRPHAHQLLAEPELGGVTSACSQEAPHGRGDIPR